MKDILRRLRFTFLFGPGLKKVAENFIKLLVFGRQPPTHRLYLIVNSKTYRRKIFWQSPLDSAKRQTKSFDDRGRPKLEIMRLSPAAESMGANMIGAFADPFDALFNLQRALEGRLMSDWLDHQTTGQGPYPPINVFQQGDDILAIIELPGVEKNNLQIQAKENTIRIAGKKAITYPEDASVHRRERTFGEFDRTLSLPVELDPDQIKAEYRHGILVLHLPRAQQDKPRTIKIS